MRPTEGKRLAVGALHQQLVELSAPPSLVVNADYQIVYLSERVGRYLQQPDGEPTNHLLKPIRSELRLELATALHQALAIHQPVQVKPLRPLIKGVTCAVSLNVQPALQPELQGHVLVIFLETAEPQTNSLAQWISSDAHDL